MKRNKELMIKILRIMYLVVANSGDSKGGPEGAMAPSDFCLAPRLLVMGEEE